MMIKSAYLFGKSICFALALGLSVQSAAADAVSDLAATTQRAFDRMPQVQVVDQIAGNCGADGRVNPAVGFCTTSNIIFLSAGAAARPEAAYLVAHSFGHAVQVRHGIADIALREITSRRAEEATLRGYVASQVECVAGFLLARAGLPAPNLPGWFDREPFAGSHWGRSPLSRGPQVSIGLAQRQAWALRGYQSNDLSACAAGEFGAELLLRAFRP